MALVVTARAPARLDTGQWLGLRSLAASSTVLCALALVVDSAARALPATASLETASLLANSAAAILTLVLCVAAWCTHRDDGGVLMASTLALVLAGVREAASAVMIALDMSTLADVVSSSLGLLVLGSLVWTAAAWRPAIGRADISPRRALFCRVVEVTSFVLFAVALSGAVVQAVGASWACQGAFPDCNGLGALPFGRDPQADIQLYHRLLSYVGFGLVAWLTIEAFR